MLALLTAFPALAQARLSQPHHQDDRALSGRRHHRPARPHGRRPAQERAQCNRRVENKPGAGTALGADYPARSEPDGYTLLMATSTTLAINKTLYRKLPYDPACFTPIALVAGMSFARSSTRRSRPRRSPPSSPTPKSKPGLAYGSAGNGSPQHLGAEMLKAATGIDIRHTPYRGNFRRCTTSSRGTSPS